MKYLIQCHSLQLFNLKEEIDKNLKLFKLDNVEYIPVDNNYVLVRFTCNSDKDFKLNFCGLKYFVNIQNIFPKWKKLDLNIMNNSLKKPGNSSIKFMDKYAGSAFEKSPAASELPPVPTEWIKRAKS